MPRPPAENTVLPASESDFDRLFELSLDLICVSGLDGYLRRVNPSWPRVLGWSEEELLRRPVVELIHPDDRERTLQARAGLSQGLPLQRFENRYLCKDGSYRWLSWQSITDPDTSRVFAIARDVTEQRQADAERVIVSRLESTGILASGIAHDFNNLFTSLLLNIEMVGLSDPVTPQQERFLQQARQTVLSARDLTKQLTTFAGAEAGARRALRLEPLIQQAIALTLRDAHHLAVDCAVAPDLHFIRGNETQLTQVLRGLLLNAREAVQSEGRIEIRAENTPVMLPGLPAGDYVRITVRDNGVGIPGDILPRVFDPYFSTKKRGAQKGMGLSLTLCRVLIERHGGRLLLESEPGRGTVVTFYLPVTTEQPGAPA